MVYASGALCRRRARVTVPPDGRVRLSGLPRVLDPGSLRASVLGGDGLRVTEVRLAEEAELRAPQARPELRRLVEEAADALEAAEGRHARLFARIEEVAALRAVPPPRRRDEPHRRTPADAWLDLADFVDERLTGLHIRAAQLADELRRAEHAFAVARERLESASSALPSGAVQTTVTAVLTIGAAGTEAGTDQGTGLDTDQGTEVDIELEYGVPGAVWAPSYRLSHRQGAGDGTLVLCASVAQRTGEDWTGVRLALSTADLNRRTDLPRLRSVRIGRRQPAPAPSGWREAPGGLDDLFAGYDAAAPLPAPPRRRAMPFAAGGAAPGPAAVPYGAASAGGPAPAVPPAAPAPGPFGGPGGPGGPGEPDAALPLMARRSRMAAPAALSAPPPVPQTAPGSGSRPEPGTAGPAAPAGPPHPDPRWLDYAALTLPGPDGGRADRGRLLPGGGPGADPAGAGDRHRAEAVAALPLPPHAVRPRLSAGSFDQRYDTAARVDLPSDGGWHTVTVGEIPVGLRSGYVCVPSVEEAVYGTLVLTNATDRALLAGPVEVTVDGEFLLTAALPTLAPGGSRGVGLGVAEGIRVARRTELRESTAGMLGNTTVLDHRVHLELANHLGRPVTVEVRERVPVSSDGDVRIEERPGWTTGEPSEDYPPSTRHRRVELPAHGSAELDGGYEIRIPAGKTLHGGNRRS
ncbi:hypothetical protein GCM10009760_56150 [Kitasatospora kazusensis]|uniref:DUF4139 domain-containing protein n=1 Tax=Kitasatospora kazusensis TaxID=407974 RepID=A0ABN3A7X1_9ACTN